MSHLGGFKFLQKCQAFDARGNEDKWVFGRPACGRGLFPDQKVGRFLQELLASKSLELRRVRTIQTQAKMAMSKTPTFQTGR